MSRGEDGDSRRAEHFLGVLLRAYPRSFREQFGASLLYGLLQDHKSAGQQGRLERIGFWMRVPASLLWNGILERVGHGGREAWPLERDAIHRAARSGRGTGMEQLWRELGFALRRLARRPGFSFTAAGTLALGIGATTAIFTVVNGVILSPLPYPAPERLVRVGHRSSTGPLAMPDGAYFYFADHASTLQSLALYLESSAPVTGTGEPLELGIIQATPSLFPTLGITRFMGRIFTSKDAQSGAQPVAVVSYAYWQQHLGGDPEAVGKPILEGAKQIVVGILPQGFEFPRPQASFVFGNPFHSPDIYLPLTLNRSAARYGNFMYQGIGRLAPGASPADAEAELKRLMPRAAETYTGTEQLGSISPQELLDGGYSPVVTRVKDAMVGDVAQVLWILLGAVAVVFLIAVANVANLFLVRAEARRTELAVERALGAGRASVVRSFLSEGALLAILGGGMGILLAWGATRLLIGLAPGEIPRLEQVSLDPEVVAFTAGITLLAAMVFGVLPLPRLARLEVASELASGGRGASLSRVRRRGQGALVVLQVALALVLLSSSGLLLRTFHNLTDVDPGFDPSHVLTLRLSLGLNLVRDAGYDAGPADAARSHFMMDLTSRLGALPGVEEATFTGDLPLDDALRYDYVAAEGALPHGLDPETKALRVFIGPGYLKTIGAHLREGRELERSEFAGQPHSVVVNETFARQRWPGEDPVGKRLLQYWSGVDPDQDVWYTVVGVVADIREKSLMSPPEPTVYLPTMFLREGGYGMMPVSNFVAVVRTSGSPEAMIPAIRRVVRQFDPEVPINHVQTLEQLTARSFQKVTFAMVLLIIAGAVSAVLGLVGVYGTVAYVVGSRRREFGLRMALGATGRAVRRDVVREAFAVGLVGVVLGVVGALAAGRVLHSLLFGVAYADPEVLITAAVGLMAAVAVASLVPAARAAGVDPVEAIRAE